MIIIIERSYGFLNGVSCDVGGATTELKLCSDRDNDDDTTEDDDRKQAVSPDGLCSCALASCMVSVLFRSVVLLPQMT